MRLKPRYRVTIDVPEEFARKLDAIMTAKEMTQSEVFRAALLEYYDHHVKGENHDETPAPGSGDPPRGGGF